MNEIGRWAPTLTPVKFHGDKTNREEIANNILCPGQRDSERKWHVCITTYEVCNIEKNVLNKFAWTYLIIDEAHRLKNEASTFSSTVRSFETRYRILLTGLVDSIRRWLPGTFDVSNASFLLVKQDPASEFSS
jgi:SWI/SNF-related matrix-associated actin-dependent regulator of chromatin subfamily A member 5